MAVDSPPERDYVHVVQRLGASVGDGSDSDDKPDFVPVTEGTITFVPTVSSVKGLDPEGDPVLYVNAPIVCALNEQGHLIYTGGVPVDEQGQPITPVTPGVWLPDLGSSKVVPPVPRDKAAYSVTYSGMKYQGQPFKMPSVNINPVAGTELDLTDATSLPLPSGITMDQISAIASDAIAAKEAAEAAAASIAGQKGVAGGFAALDAITGKVLDADGDPVEGASDADVAALVTGSGDTAVALGAAYAAKAVSPDGGVRAVGKGELVLNAADHGIVADGSTDNATALQSLANSVSAAGGGVIEFRGGDVHFGSNVALPAGVTWRGANGVESGDASRTRLIFDGAAGPALTISGRQIGMESLTVLANDAMTGTMVSHVEPGNAFITVRGCWFGSVTPWQTTYAMDALWDLRQSQAVSFENCMFYGATDLVHGLTAGDSTSANYANQIAFRSCTFNRYAGWIVRNPGKAWVFDNCAFEATTGTALGQCMTVDAGMYAQGVQFTGCWAGDNTGGGTWIEWRGQGLSISGGWWLMSADGLMQLPEATGGVALVGAHLPGRAGSFAVDATTARASQVVIIGCSKTSVGKYFKNDLAPYGGVWTDTTGMHTGAGFELAPGSAGNPTLKFRGTTGGVYALGADGVGLSSAGATVIGTSGGALRHYSTELGFYGASPTTRQTVPAAGAVTADDLRAALVALGLIQ